MGNTRLAIADDGDGRSASAKPRLAIIENDPGIRETLRLVLSETFSVVRAGGSVRDVTSEGIDMMLLDVHLRDGNGLVELARLRRFGWNGPVVVMTADRDERIMRRAMEDGVMGYLVKPTNPDNIRTTLLTVWRNYLTISRMDHKIAHLEQRLDNIRLVGKAKALLMERGRSEPQAHREIQDRSMREGVPMAEIAIRILEEG